MSQWTAVYKNYIHCSPRCLQPHIILTDGLSLLSRHNTVCGFPSPRLHFSVNSPSWTQETPFFVCLCFSPKDGHGIECALWADPHFLGLLQMPSSSLLTYSLVFLRVGISWLVVPSLTILCVCVCVWFSLHEVNTSWWLTFYLVVTTEEPAHGLALSGKSVHTLLINNC